MERKNPIGKEVITDQVYYILINSSLNVIRNVTMGSFLFSNETVKHSKLLHLHLTALWRIFREKTNKYVALVATGWQHSGVTFIINIILRTYRVHSFYIGFLKM